MQTGQESLGILRDSMNPVDVLEKLNVKRMLTIEQVS
jgi:hypothetical protein